jgi:hypothetical protein
MGVRFALFGIAFAIAALTGAKGYEAPGQKRMGALVSLAAAGIGVVGLIVAGRPATKTASRALAQAGRPHQQTQTILNKGYEETTTQVTAWADISVRPAEVFGTESYRAAVADCAFLLRKHSRQ